MSSDSIDGVQNPSVNTDLDVATEDRMRERPTKAGSKYGYCSTRIDYM